jgi:threonine dehydratase
VVYPVHVIVPNTASSAKIEALTELGATISTVSFSEWWQVMMSRSTELDGHFIHPVSELEVVIGNGVIGLEIVSQFPNVDVVVVPFGGGGLICGIALAMRALGKSPLIVATEIESSTPLSAARAKGSPVQVVRGSSWVDGIGSTCVLDEMWPLLDNLVDEVSIVSHKEASKALRFFICKVLIWLLRVLGLLL